MVVAKDQPSTGEQKLARSGAPTQSTTKRGSCSGSVFKWLGEPHGNVGGDIKSRWDYVKGHIMATWIAFMADLVSIGVESRVFWAIFGQSLVDSLKRRWAGWSFTSLGIICFSIEFSTGYFKSGNKQYFALSWSLLFMFLPMLHGLKAAWKYVRKEFKITLIRGFQALLHIFGGLEIVVVTSHVIMICIELLGGYSKMQNLTIILGYISGGLGLVILVNYIVIWFLVCAWSRIRQLECWSVC